MRLRWLLSTLLAALTLALVHIWALSETLYWKFRWLDTPMHVLGGFVIGAFIISFMRSDRPSFFIFSVAMLAIVWEIFELLTHAPQPNPYFFDTIHDLVNDSLGAMFAYALARDTLWRSR